MIYPSLVVPSFRTVLIDSCFTNTRSVLCIIENGELKAEAKIDLNANRADGVDDNEELRSVKTCDAKCNENRKLHSYSEAVNPVNNFLERSSVRIERKL